MMLKIRWELQAWLSGAWTTQFQALTENGLVSVATGMGVEPLSDFLASPRPRGDGRRRKRSFWVAVSFPDCACARQPSQAVSYSVCTLGGGVWGGGASQRC